MDVFVLFAKNCTNQIKSNYLNSHGEEAQEKPPGLLTFFYSYKYAQESIAKQRDGNLYKFYTIKS